MMRFVRNVSLLGLLVMGVGSAAAAAYLAPPNWSGMVMLPVSFAPGTKNLVIENAVGSARLTAAPLGTFDPGKQWSVLNGTAYSRQWGWYDDIGDDFESTYNSVLNGNHLWIEQTNPASKVKTYVVEEALNPKGSYTPIFGTAGSSTKWEWDGFMDHNANAVSLADITQPNQVFTATYHLYVGDANGKPISGYGDTTTTWSWTGPSSVPEPAVLGLISTVGWCLARRTRPQTACDCATQLR